MDAKRCAALLEAARGPGEKAYQAAFAALYQDAFEYVSAMRHLAAKLENSGKDLEDLAAEVCNKLSSHATAPKGTEGIPPAATVRKWLKTTAQRTAHDIQRKHKEELAAAPAHEEDKLAEVLEALGAPETPEADGSTAGPVESAQLLRETWSMLSACYPACRPLFESMLEGGAGGEDDAALASELRLGSAANLQQVRKRTRKYVAFFWTLLENPEATDEALVARQDPRAAAAESKGLTPDTSRILKSVRHYVTQRSLQKEPS